MRSIVQQPGQSINSAALFDPATALAWTSAMVRSIAAEAGALRAASRIRANADA